jgi:hypothetical protein
MPFAPKDDYISGFKCHVADHNRMVADPYEFEFLLFLQSRGGSHFSRIKLRVPPPLQGVTELASLQYRLNPTGSRDLRNGPQFKAEELRCDMGSYVAIGDRPWWTQDQQVLPVFSAEDSRRLIGDGSNPYIVGALAANPNTASDVLVSIARKADRSLNEALGRNPSAPPELLKVLAGDPDMLVRDAVAENPALSLNLVALLEHDPQAQVRMNIVHRPDRTAEDLIRYSKDQFDAVRASVPDQPNCPDEVLYVLAKDPAIAPRCAVARRRTLPQGVLNILNADTDPTVQSVVRLWH